MMTRFNELPLGELFISVNGGGTPPRDVDEYWKGNIPWASVKDFTNDVFKLEKTKESITELGLLNSTSKLVKAGTPIICLRMAVGRAAIAIKDVSINQDLKALYTKEEVDPVYLVYLLDFVRSEIEARSIGSTVKGITTSELLRIKVPFPENHGTQQKIANILSTVDKLIENTQTLIDKYTAIKQGMMADLFTRGIDLSPGPDGTAASNPNYGQLRPSFDTAPELYQQTKLGCVPKEWDVKKASDICLAIIDCKNRTPPETEEGFVVLKTFNIKQGQLKFERLTYTDEESFGVWTERGEPTSGDIVITREAPIGESFLIESNMPKMCLGQRMMLYRPHESRIDPSFMYYTTRTEVLQKRLIELAGGSTVGHVKVGDIRDLLFFVPSIEEQKTIAERLRAFDSKLALEVKYLMKLKEQKKGLMQDLLTGKVKVN